MAPFDTVSAELDPNRNARLRSQGSGSVLKKKKPSVEDLRVKNGIKFLYSDDGRGEVEMVNIIKMFRSSWPPTIFKNT